jgi:hypothetical protein
MKRNPRIAFHHWNIPLDFDAEARIVRECGASQIRIGD